MGKTYPDPTEVHTLKDGVVVPIGKPIEDTKLKSDLLYNEYIVYGNLHFIFIVFTCKIQIHFSSDSDVAQVNIKYLFKMKFNYNR